MSILHKRYAQLRPTIELLSDEAVLAQAWKKSDTFIRQHNWYADVLELEQATVRLPQLIPEWALSIQAGEVAPEPMRLVPAPKNAKWEFQNKKSSKDWGVKKSTGSKPSPLRPLAHLTIRDQTFATAVMMCLADAVETAQGNTDQPDYRTAQRKSVFSYGNRLFCDWKAQPNSLEKARFRWGNTNTYSQFFTDYQRFLERPAEVCRDHEGQSAGLHLYVVKLDLSKFYDCIDRFALLEQLKSLYDEHAKAYGVERDATAEASFWERTGQLLTWTWGTADKKKSGLFANGKLPDGLPQGLVASGFFANAYLHKFDKKIGDKLGGAFAMPTSVLVETPIDEWILGARLLDYCRYVDDIRLVVAVPTDGSEVHREDALRKLVTSWINHQLEDYKQFLGAVSSLTIGDEKTEIIAWEDFAEEGRVSQYVKGVQGQISVVPDVASLRQTTGNLDHLLWLADSLEEDTGKENQLTLSRISSPRMDMRDDTIKRFAANRLRKVLRMRRSMASPDASPPAGNLSAPGTSELKSVDHEMETVARKLIACWARNPALVTVLRCGLDLCPSPELLRPVLEALRIKIKKGQPSNEREVALYVAADLLKAGAIETGWRKPEDYPEHSDIVGYRLELKILALDLLEIKALPWFVSQQAALFLAVMQHPVHGLKGSELKSYAALHGALTFGPVKSADPENALSTAILAQQLTGDAGGFALWMSRFLGKQKAVVRRKLIEQTLLAAPDLLRVTASLLQIDKPSWSNDLPDLQSTQAPAVHLLSLEHFNQKSISLSVITRHPDNPFVQETALLKLAEALLKDEVAFLLESCNIGLGNIQVVCADWGRVQNPDTPTRDFELMVNASSLPSVLKESPIWCAEGFEWIYTLGRILRSAIIGEDDFTTRYHAVREQEPGAYRGIRSSWYKRRMGLAPISSGIGIEQTPLSPWFSELILRMLQWPGLEIGRDLVRKFPDIQNRNDLVLILQERRNELGRLYGKLSKLPVYLIPNENADNSDPEHFRVAIVQTLLPKDSDFCPQDPTSWTPGFRNMHRAHLAAMCHLVDQQLIAAQSALPSEKRAKKPLDLVVFPELSVHPDDTWLLISLSDRTGAAIFAGQTFVKHPHLNRPINRGVWLLRQSLHTGRQIVKVFQGKQHPIDWETQHGVLGHRPFQIVIQFVLGNGKKINLTGAICYDATDLRLAADLREISDGFVIAALNKDINTFDTMASALQYHMYQPVILANTGQYGGSTAQAPYKEPFHRLIAHTHGNNQAAISLFEIDLGAFKSGKTPAPSKEVKTPPAGYKGRE